MFEVIGEKINGTRKSVGTAVVERDTELIRSLAVRQAEAGASWIDVNAGTRSDREPEDLAWLVNTVQAVVDVPLCLDSANPEALAAASGETTRTPLLNSISGEAWRLDSVLPLARDHGCPVIAYGVGGATESVVDGKTGVWFEEQTVDCLAAAIERAEGIAFGPIAMHAYTQRFSHARFLREMREVLTSVLG